MNVYEQFVLEIKNKVILALIAINSKSRNEEYNSFKDSKEIEANLYWEVGQFLAKHTMLMDYGYGLTLKACQFIAGNSPSIEASFEAMNRRDTFSEVCRRALVEDVRNELLKNEHFVAGGAPSINL